MKNRLHLINLLGVLVLAALCAAQWQRDRQLNLELNRAEKARLEQQRDLGEKEKAIRALGEDLAHFKEQFRDAHTNSAGLEIALRKSERENLQLQSERDQLKSSVTNWVAAMAARDERLKEAQHQARELADRLIKDGVL